MVGCHHWFSGHKFKRTRGGEGQGHPACCPWGRRVGHNWVTGQQQQNRTREIHKDLNKWRDIQYSYSWDIQYSYTVLNIEISGLLKLTSVFNAIRNRIPVAWFLLLLFPLLLLLLFFWFWGLKLTLKFTQKCEGLRIAKGVMENRVGVPRLADTKTAYKTVSIKTA